MSADFDRLREIFLAALEHASEQRDAYLDQVCAGDDELRRNVAVMLKAQAAGEGPLDRGPARDPQTGAYESESEIPGTVIGPYKLIEQIGEGGMGTVWMAQQTEPVKRVVALKLIKAGMDSKQVIARFEAERQALALMDHPNIAKVFDGGTTSSPLSSLGRVAGGEGWGRPYFVMELVKGVPITKYCDEHHLTPRQRLELFVPVCHAIQHAHQKGIIHRDLKPSNVLIALYDGKPVPKVIDFGVAKATGVQLTDATLVTGFGAIVGTLEYMSPEQAEVNQLDIDTRSDIYSLGVLLYELLAGSPPFTRKELEKAGMLEMLRVIREQEPSKPSTKLSTAEGLPTLAANRGTEPAKLTKLVRGELDWIVMKALEKDRNRRYETANGFAMDVQRYLADEAVQACPPSVGYRFRKFARRNKRALATAALVGVVLLAAVGAVAGTFGWAVRDRAGRMAAVEREATNALHEALRHKDQRDWAGALSAVKRAEGLLAGDGTDELRRSVRELRRDLEMVVRLDRIRDEVMSGIGYESEKRFDVAHADSEYRRAFAEYGIEIDVLPHQEAANRLGSPSVAAELAAALDSWALARSSLANGDKSWKSLLALAKAADPDDWRRRLRDAWERKDRPALQALAVSEQVHRLPPHTLYLLGVALREVGDLDGAVAFLRKAQQLHPDDYWINIQLVHYYAWEVKPKQRDEGVRYAMAANAARKQSAAPYRYLASSLDDKGHLDEAIAANREAIRLKPNYWAAHYNLGAVLLKKGQRDEGIAAYREASRHNSSWAWPHAALAQALSEKGNAPEAEAEVREALRLAPKDAAVQRLVGMALVTMKKLDEALSCGRKAVELDPTNASAHNFLGAILCDHLRDYKNAAACFRTAIELDANNAGFHFNLGNALSGQKKLDEAIATYRTATAINPKYVQAYKYLGQDLHSQGIVQRDQKKLDEAWAAYKKAVELDPIDPIYAHVYLRLAKDYRKLGNDLRAKKKLEEAIAAFRKAIELDSNNANAHGSLGALLCDDLKEYGKAVECFRKAIELDPNNANAHVCLGVALTKQMKWPEAIDVCKKALVIEPQHANANNVLAWLLATCPDARFRDPAQAVKLANQAVNLAPNNWGYLNTLGVAHYRAGDWKAAIAALEKSMELRKGGDSNDWFFLAMAHWQLGEQDKAREWYDRAVQWMDKNQPKDEELRRFRAEAAELLELNEKK